MVRFDSCTGCFLQERSNALDILKALMAVVIAVGSCFGLYAGVMLVIQFVEWYAQDTDNRFIFWGIIFILFLASLIYRFALKGS